MTQHEVINLIIPLQKYILFHARIHPKRCETSSFCWCVKEERFCDVREIRGADVVSCPADHTMTNIESRCPEGVHEDCVIEVECCTTKKPALFKIKRHVSAMVYPVALFDSVRIDCAMFSKGILSSISLGRIPEGVCGPARSGHCYLHHSFDLSTSVSCSPGFAFQSLSFTADGQIASPWECCAVGGEKTRSNTSHISRRHVYPVRPML
eukprot:sb/3470300/